MLYGKCHIFIVAIFTIVIFHIITAVAIPKNDPKDDNGDTYRAAIVEYNPIYDPELNPEERLNANAKEYVKIISSLVDTDIIIFPEYTLTFGGKPTVSLLPFTTLVPAPTDKIAPCDENIYENFLRTLSCAARQYNLYVSIDLLERFPEDGNFLIHNTNVVFDRNGYVVSRYRKYNLHGEPGVNPPPQPEVEYFTTDFGVTFGVLICFDLLHFAPSMDLLNQGVRHIIFPSMWYSGLPYLTALQVQQMWSFKNDVVLLAAGANNPDAASGGSAIYQGNLGQIETYFHHEPSTKVIIHDVLKDWKNGETITPITNGEALMNYWDNEFDNYTTEFLREDQTDYILHAENNFSCTFHIELSKELPKEYFYRLFAYHGLRTFSTDLLAGIELCLLIGCRTRDVNSCSDYFIPSSTLKFDEIVITAHNESSQNVLYYPNMLSLSYQLFPVDIMEWSEFQSNRSIKLNNPLNNIKTFGIFGRYD